MDFWLSTFHCKIFAGLPRTRELGMLASRFRRRVCQDKETGSIRGCFVCSGPAVICRARACRSKRRRAKTRISIWPTAGFVGSVWRARCRITPTFRRTSKVAFVTATLPATPRWPVYGTNGGSSGFASREVPRRAATAWHSGLLTRPPDPRHRNVGNASAAQLDRNQNHAHQVWL